MLIIGAVIYLLHFVIFSVVGWVIARADKLPYPEFFGIACGVIPFGILCLIGIWLGEKVIALLGGRTA